MDQFGCAVRLEDQAFRDVADRCLGIFRATDGEKSLMLLGRQSYLIRPLFTERKTRPQDRSQLSQRSIVAVLQQSVVHDQYLFCNISSTDLIGVHDRHSDVWVKR